jgi:hypothetical protein
MPKTKVQIKQRDLLKERIISFPQEESFQTPPQKDQGKSHRKQEGVTVSDGLRVKPNERDQPFKNPLQFKFQ